jgi:molybdate transport system substrate-binding protein
MVWLRYVTFAATVFLAGPLTAARAEDPIVVFAAASLKTAFDEAAAQFHSAGGADVKISYGGSLGLARQIVAGAPADVYASADEASMDEAAKGGAIRPESRFDLLRNQLVVVAPKSAAFDTLALTSEALAQAIGDGHLATGDVNTVPVGKYARASLLALGLWSVVEPHLAMTDNVRSALAFVARNEAQLGIVYATDAAAEPMVKIVATLPDDTHPPILYPFAVTASSHNASATKFLDFLKSPSGRAIFEHQGFSIVQ